MLEFYRSEVKAPAKAVPTRASSILFEIDGRSAVLIPRRACPEYIEGIKSAQGWRMEYAMRSFHRKNMSRG